MLTDEQKKEVKQIVSDYLIVPFDELNETDDLKEAHGMDSLDRLYLIVELETSFDCRIDDDKIDYIKTLNDFYEAFDYIISK